MPKLVFTNKHFEEQSYTLILEKTTVGRDNHNNLVICDNSVSHHHCEILMNGPEIIVRDLGSSNGTYVDGRRLNNEQSQVKDGHIIRFGLVEARLELDALEDDSSAEKTAIHELSSYKAKVRREARNPKPDPAGKVEPSASPGGSSEGHTVLLPRPPMRVPSQESGSGDTEVTRRGSRNKILVIVIALATGIAMLIWAWLKK